MRIDKSNLLFELFCYIFAFLASIFRDSLAFIARDFHGNLILSRISLSISNRSVTNFHLSNQVFPGCLATTKVDDVNHASAPEPICRTTSENCPWTEVLLNLFVMKSCTVAFVGRWLREIISSARKFPRRLWLIRSSRWGVVKMRTRNAWRRQRNWRRWQEIQTCSAWRKSCPTWAQCCLQ